jgi:hypothetical protein
MVHRRNILRYMYMQIFVVVFGWYLSLTDQRWRQGNGHTTHGAGLDDGNDESMLALGSGVIAVDVPLIIKLREVGFRL